MTVLRFLTLNCLVRTCVRSPDLRGFEKLVCACLSDTNAERTAATEQLQKLSTQPDAFFAHLVGVLVKSQAVEVSIARVLSAVSSSCAFSCIVLCFINGQVRQFSAVILRQV